MSVPDFRRWTTAPTYSSMSGGGPSGQLPLFRSRLPNSNQISHSLIWNSANCRLYWSLARPHDEKLELQALHDRLLSFTHEETKYYEGFTEVERLGPAIPDFIFLRYYSLHRMTSKLAYFEDRLTRRDKVSEFDQELLTKLLSDHGTYVLSTSSHNRMC